MKLGPFNFTSQLSKRMVAEWSFDSSIGKALRRVFFGPDAGIGSCTCPLCGSAVDSDMAKYEFACIAADIDAGRFALANARLARVAKYVGYDHDEVVRLGTIIALLESKPDRPMAEA